MFGLILRAYVPTRIETWMDDKGEEETRTNSDIVAYYFVHSSGRIYGECGKCYHMHDKDEMTTMDFILKTINL